MRLFNTLAIISVFMLLVSFSVTYYFMALYQANIYNTTHDLVLSK